eukprot:scaffold91695_cov19-Prasinocladus_malaysianus.AAC.1
MTCWSAAWDTALITAVVSHYQTVMELHPQKLANSDYNSTVRVACEVQDWKPCRVTGYYEENQWDTSSMHHVTSTRTDLPRLEAAMSRNHITTIGL